MSKIKVLSVEPTPNPNAMKFVLSGVVSHQPRSFFNAAEGVSDPLAAKLFEIPGTSAVLILGNFITISREPSAAWNEIKNKVKQCIEANAQPAM